MIPAISIDPAPAASGALTNELTRTETKGEKTELPPSKAVQEVDSVPPTAVQKMVRDLSEAEAEAREASARADAAKEAAMQAKAEANARSEEVSEAKKVSSNQEAKAADAAPQEAEEAVEVGTGDVTVGEVSVGATDATTSTGEEEAVTRAEAPRDAPRPPPPPPPGGTGEASAIATEEAEVIETVDADQAAAAKTGIARDVEIVNGAGEPEPESLDFAA